MSMASPKNAFEPAIAIFKAGRCCSFCDFCCMQVTDVTTAAEVTWDPVLDSPYIEALLGFHPRLKHWQAGLIYATSIVIGLVFYALASPSAVCLPYAGAVVVLCGVLILVLRAATLEKKYQVRTESRAPQVCWSTTTTDNPGLKLVDLRKGESAC